MPTKINFSIINHCVFIERKSFSHANLVLKEWNRCMWNMVKKCGKVSESCGIVWCIYVYEAKGKYYFLTKADAVIEMSGWAQKNLSDRKIVQFWDWYRYTTPILLYDFFCTFNVYTENFNTIRFPDKAGTKTKKLNKWWFGRARERAIILKPTQVVVLQRKWTVNDPHFSTREWTKPVKL